jgi:hypothetical protein
MTIGSSTRPLGNRARILAPRRAGDGARSSSVTVERHSMEPPTSFVLSPVTGFAPTIGRLVRR